jgi:hypothetical protein
MKKLSHGVAGAVLCWGSAALAFEPVPYTEVSGLVGKTVYAATITELRGREAKGWVYAGEPLTLAACEPQEALGNKDAEGNRVKGLSYNFCTVKTEDGREGELQLRFMSRAPLEYNLRKPAKAEALARAVFEEAYPLPKQLHELRGRFHYALDSGSTQVEKDGQLLLGDEYHQVDSMEEAFKFNRGLLRGLMSGSGYGKESLMRNEEHKWAALAEDETVLEWYSQGMPAAQKKKFTEVRIALDSLDNVSSTGHELAELDRQKEAKPWREGLTDFPEEKLKKLDAENFQKLDKRRAELTSRITKAFNEAEAVKKKLK